MSFTQMLFAADFCPPFDPGLKFSKKSKTSRTAELHTVFIWPYSRILFTFHILKFSFFKSKTLLQS